MHLKPKLPSDFKTDLPAGRSPLPPGKRSPAKILFRAKHVRRRVVIQVRLSRRKGTRYQPVFTVQQMLLAWAGSFVAIALLAYLSYYSRYPMIAAPMGATSVLLYGVPQSPLSQPRNVIAGSVIGAIVAVLCLKLFGTAPWVMAAAVATTILVMKCTRTVHPPAGAVALVGVMSNVSWDFIIAPVLLGAVVMVLLACLMSRFAAPKSYPNHWF